jgi:hypothetical protein
MIDGFHLELWNTENLTEEDRTYLVGQMGIFAVSPYDIFHAPVEVRPQRIEAHYLYEGEAHETEQHIKAYLQELGLDEKITVVLQHARWERKEEFPFPKDLLI